MRASRAPPLRALNAARDVETDTSPTTTKAAEAASDTPRYTIQQAKYSHISQIADIITSSFHPELDSNIFMRPLHVLLETDRLQSNFPYDDDNHYYLVMVEQALDNDEIIVGFCDLDFRSPPNHDTDIFTLWSSSSSNHIIRQRPYLSDLAIHPRRRRKGLASELMNAAHEYTRNRGMNGLYLAVAEDNVGALKMYSGLGYDVLDYFKGKDGFGVDDTVRLLRKEL